MRDKREKFISLAEARLNRAAKEIRLIGNLSNKSLYAYTDIETRTIVNVLQRELDATKNRILPRVHGRTTAFRLED